MNALDGRVVGTPFVWEDPFLEEFSGGHSFDLRYKGDAEMSGASRTTIVVVERRKAILMT